MADRVWNRISEIYAKWGIELARAFADACQPWHDRRGTTGYLSYTFTIPKEISLVAEGTRARPGRRSMPPSTRR